MHQLIQHTLDRSQSRSPVHLHPTLALGQCSTFLEIVCLFHYPAIFMGVSRQAEKKTSKFKQTKNARNISLEPSSFFLERPHLASNHACTSQGPLHSFFASFASAGMSNDSCKMPWHTCKNWSSSLLCAMWSWCSLWLRVSCITSAMVTRAHPRDVPSAQRKIERE